MQFSVQIGLNWNRPTGTELGNKIVLRTRIPAQWQESKSFGKQISEKINKRITKGQMSENKDGKD